jgi:predicted small metal-binding protein
VGKAGTGKNTAAEMMIFSLPDIYWHCSADILAFADPIKEIVYKMFPHVKREHLFGPSHFRNEIIAGAKDSENNPLTIRRALLDMGTRIGRGYNDNVWLDNMGYRIKDAEQAKQDMVLITDVRFRNEFDWLKSQDFFMIKVVRDDLTSINHISETGQDEIKDSEYNYILSNNGTKDDLIKTIKKDIIPILSCV